MDILVSRTLYMSCQAGQGIEPGPSALKASALPIELTWQTKDSVLFSLGVLKFVVCLCKGCDGCCVFCLYYDVWSWWCSCMESVSFSSCRYCMFVSSVHPVAVLNAAFCMTFSLLMLVEDARGDHIKEVCFRGRRMPYI